MLRRIALLAAVLPFGCYRSTSVRVPTQRTVEATREVPNGTELRLRVEGVDLDPVVLSVVAEEQPMCRRAERGSATFAVERSFWRSGPQRFEGLLYGVPLTVVGAIGVGRGGATGGPSAALLVLGVGLVVWGLAPSSYTERDETPAAEPFDAWGGERTPCGPSRAAAHVPFRASSARAGGETASARGETGEDGTARLSLGQVLAPTADDPLRLRLEVPGLPERLDDDPLHPGLGRTHAPLDVLIRGARAGAEAPRN